MAKIYCKSSYLLRKDTAENWQNKNPILRKGEQGLETDTGIMKIGDGTTAFNSLSEDNIYFPKSYADNAFSNALKGSKSGSSILIDDVSPVTHNMGVKISSNTITDLRAVKVSRCGKNFFDTINAVKLNGGSDFSVINNTITVSQNSLLTYVSANVLIPQSLIGKTITISAKTNASGANKAELRMQWITDSGLAIGDMILGLTDSAGNIVVTGTVPPQPDEAHNNLCLMFYSNSSGTLETVKTYTATYSDIQVELGSTATNYEPYITLNEYTPTADGTVEGVTSLYPNTTLTTDTDGVIIDCEYNRDINKFGDLTEYVKHTDIDQTYSPTSENAQSGKAVAEALAAFGGEYELIETITLEEAVKTITRNTEPSGKAYSFKDVFIKFSWNTTDTTKWILLEISADVKKADAFRDLMQGVGTSWVQTLNCYGKRLFLFSNRSTNTSYAQYGAQIPIKYLDSNKPIDALKIQYQTEMPVGTVIEIWGVRA